MKDQPMPQALQDLIGVAHKTNSQIYDNGLKLPTERENSITEKNQFDSTPSATSNDGDAPLKENKSFINGIKPKSIFWVYDNN